MFYPKTKHSKPERTTGQYILANGKRYIGLFIRLFDGRLFTGSSFTPESQQLFEVTEPLYEDQEIAVGSINTQFVDPPSEKDYERGKIKRYFLKDKRTGKITETDRLSFTEAKNQRNIQRTVIDWRIVGPEKSYTISGYMYMGVYHENESAVKNSGMDGLGEFINEDYTRYNRPIEPVNADSIIRVPNPTSFTIPSPGKKLR